MMMTKSPWMLLILSALPVALFACGGGGGGGIGGTGDEVVSVGPITRFGSVVVNGVEFRTGAGTVFEVEGVPSATENDLKVGMVVEVRGRLDEAGSGGDADVIHFEDNLEGPIAAKSAAETTLSVLGQSVNAEEAVFAGTTFADLVPGDFVEVSGQADATGAIRATFIEKKTPGGEMEIRGTVSGHDPQNRMFSIGSQKVSYAGVEPRDGLLQDGVIVEVKSIAGTDASGVLVSSVVEIKQPALAEAAAMKVEFEGFVRDLEPPARFRLNGRLVDASQADFGEDALGDLADNVKVEVEGILDANGVLVAQQVQIKRPRTIKIEADVTAKDETSVTLLGIRVLVGRGTQFERSFGLDSISPGERLEVRAYESASSGNVIASRIERGGNPADPVILQGRVTGGGVTLLPDLTVVSLTILGVSVETVALTEFKDLEDGSLSAGEFFGRLNLGTTVVKARGQFAADTKTITVQEVSLEGPKTPGGSN